jgi:hypothetical protein
VRRSPLLLAAGIVVGLLVLASLTGVELRIFSLIFVLLNLAVFLAFLALATWVVAIVWKSVMRR